MNKIKIIFFVFFICILIQREAHSFSVYKFQNFSDESFDPFADYSEFEETEEEESDINFFKNGRFFTLGFISGRTSFTENLGQITEPAIAFGGYLSYFFDLRFAIQFSFLTGANNYKFYSPSKKLILADSTVNNFEFSLKYYVNTKNVTHGLARLNPYFLIGFSQVSRTLNSTGSIDVAKDNTLGFDLAAGIEIPLMKNKMYFGLEAGFHLINFKDENSELYAGTEATGIYPTGDMLSLLGILGVNF